MDYIIQYLHTHQIILLLLVITTGFMIGRVKIFGFSLESSGILFSGMIFGELGFTLSHDFQVLGLLLFIYAIGLQSGPSILNMSRKQGQTLYTLVFLLLGLGAGLTLLIARLWHIDMPLAIGLFAGAMTSTPGLAAAQEATQSALTSTGYGVAYPFGVIGVILFIKLMPVLFRVKISDEEADFRKESHRSRIKIITKCVEITNKELDGKTLIQLNFAATTGTIISRILHKNKVLIPGADTSLHTGDIVRLVGNSEKIEAAIPYLGHESEQGCPEASYFGSQKFVVTNKEIVGKSLAELHLYAYYQVNITRIRRGGVEFVAEPHHKLQWGDRVRVAGDAEQMEKVKKLFGDEMKKLESGDIFSILFGILLGIAVGLIPFSIGKVISFNLGLTGGVLLAGIFLSNRGKIGPVIWQVPVPIITFMRELGLTLFLSVVGIKAGAQVFETFQHQGLKLLLTGAAITLIPMIITAIVARVKYKMMLIELFGMLSGGMTSTPGLAVGTGMTSLQRPLIIYATVYPVAMILMMFWTKILALF